MKKPAAKHLQQIIACTLDAVICLDDKQVIFMFNQAAEQMFGIPAEKAIGSPLADLTAEHFRAQLEKFAKSSDTQEFYGLHAQGHEFPADARPSYIGTGDARFLALILRDATQRLGLENTLSRMAASTPGSFIVYRMISAEQGRFIYMSPNIREIFGESAENLKTNPLAWVKLIHPDDQERILREGRRSFKEGTLNTVQEYRVQHADKGEIWVESRHTVERLADGAANIFIYLSEITARKRQEISRHESEHPMRELLDNMAEGYQVVGFDWRYKFFNKTFIKHSRYTAEELQNHTVLELYPGIENTPIYAVYQRCFRERVAIRVENEFQFPDGSIGWFDLFFQPTSEGLSILSVDITERKRHEIVVRESERKLHEAVRISGVGSFELDLITGEVQGSPRLLEIFGMPPGKKLTRDDFFRLVHPDDYQDLLVASDAALRGEGPLDLEYRIMRTDGTIIWVRSRAELVTEPNGRKRYTGALVDITSGKLAQRTLEQSEERFRQVVENIDEVFWMSDAEKDRIIYISPAYEKVWGRTMLSLYASPRTWLDAIHPDDRSRVLQAALGQISGTYNEEYRIIRPDGKVLWIADRAFPVRDAAGKVYRIAGVAQDITERKRLQTELARFVELSPTVLYALRADGNILKATWRSQNLVLLTGHNANDSDAETWWLDNLHPDDRERVLEAHPTPYTIEHQVIEFRFRKKDGGYIWIRDEKRLIPHQAGGPTEIIGSWSDITERMQLETQMRQAQKMEAIGQLAAGVAHDFNNLLTIIKGNADLVRTEPALSQDAREFMADIASATEKAEYLTRQLLLVGRHQTLQLKQLDLGDALLETVGMLRRVLGDDIALRFIPPTETLKVYADGALLSQILLNLGVNARDAMPAGGTLSIECNARLLDETMARSIPQAKPGHYACFSVSDTGEGIPPDVRTRIFEPFFTTKEVGKGTGLGLATVFGIIQQHQGWINVYSELGHGTTFRVYLPLVQGKEMKDERNAAAAAAVQIGTETVLVVEDQLTLRKLARTILSRLGYHVLEAGTGREALVVWEQFHGKIDLVMTDIVMPDGMSGFELGEKLAQQKSDLQIIFTSGYSPDLIKMKNKLVEGENFLTKPYSMADLSAIVRRNLDGFRTA